jgi:pimeloyl-ACP methyl ester carboxylesterase
MHTIEGPSGKLHVSDGGGAAGVPMVFLHGLGSDLEVWRSALEHERPIRRAVAFDARGHGKSDPPRDGDYTVQAMAADVDAVARALGIERFVLVGHSMAGTVLSAYAGMHPEKLAALVYVDAVGDETRAPREILEQLRREAHKPGYGPAQMQTDYEEMLGPLARPQTREAVLASVARLSPRGYAAIRDSMFAYDPKPDLARYGGPKVAIEAEGPDFPIFASKMQGVVRRGIPSVSHWLMLDDPQSFERELDAFLNTLP